MMSKKLCLLSPMLGTGEDLLYWGPVLKELSKMSVDVSICTGFDAQIDSLPEIKQKPKIGFFKYKGFVIPKYSAIIRILKMRVVKATFLVVEFNLISLIATFVMKKFSSSKIVLLVENSPVYLEGYGIKRSNFFLKLRRYQARLSDCVVSNNEKGRFYLCNSLFVDNKKIIVGAYLSSVLKVRNPVKKKWENIDRLKIVSVGQLIGRKGFDRLIEELTFLDDKIISSIVIDVYGQGCDEFYLKDLANRRCVGDTINFKGTVPYERLGDVIQNYHIFIMPTLADYRSLASFEAISVGLPLLQSKYDGSSDETLIEEGNGYSIDPCKRGDMADKITKIYNNREKLKKMSDCSLMLSKKYTPKISAKILHQAFLKVNE